MPLPRSRAELIIACREARLRQPIQMNSSKKTKTSNVCCYFCCSFRTIARVCRGSYFTCRHCCPPELLLHYYIRAGYVSGEYISTTKVGCYDKKTLYWAPLLGIIFLRSLGLRYHQNSWNLLGFYSRLPRRFMRHIHGRIISVSFTAKLDPNFLSEMF